MKQVNILAYNFLNYKSIFAKCSVAFFFLLKNDYEIQSQLIKSKYLAVEKATGNKILIKNFEGYDISKF